MAHDITIVIPVFNRKKELQRCLDSIAAQSVSPGKVIIVDDGSTDRSAEIARNHPVVSRVVEGEHKGATCARNLGLQHVESEWTMFFDSDDTMERDHIKSALEAIAHDTDLIGWDVKRIALDGKVSIQPFEPNDIQWHNIMHGTLATQRYMARTEFFRRAGGWNPDVRVWNDIELGSRLLLLSPRVVKIKGINVNVLQSEVSITGMSWSANRDKYDGVFKALETNIGSVHHDWLNLKKAILAADIARENAREGRLLYDAIRDKTPTIRFAYHYRKLGGRGAARLLRPFFSR